MKSRLIMNIMSVAGFTSLTIVCEKSWTPFYLALLAATICGFILSCIDYAKAKP
jgi:hypothetical protein